MPAPVSSVLTTQGPESLTLPTTTITSTLSTIEIDQPNNPFLENQPLTHPASGIEYSADEESTGYGSEIIPATDDSSSEMDTNNTISRDFERTPTPTDSTLGKRPTRSSTDTPEKVFNPAAELNRKQKRISRKGNLSSISTGNQPKRNKNSSS